MRTYPTRHIVLAVAGLLGLLGSTAADAAPTPAAAEPNRPVGALDLTIQKARLDNGLRVVLNPDQSPNVAICVTYDVGARNEEPGRSGFAHLFEHMMFQGSGNVEKGEHFKLITARGGTLNGTTSSDRTNYFEVLPANEIALGLWLEADRMKSLAVTPENLANQRAVVQEEYRMRVSNQAYALGYMRLNELVFEGYFPYAHDAIGSMQDLDAAKFEWVKAFHEQYYAPNNAVLTVSGGFDPDRAMALIRDYFGNAVPQKTVPAYDPSKLPEQKEARSAKVEDQNAKTPGVYYGWAIPPNRTPAHYALELAAIILGDGESSNLHRRLVREQAIARSVGAWTNDHRGPDLFAIRALLTERATFDQVERVVEQEIRRLMTQGPTEAELEKAKNRLFSYFAFGIQSNLDRAVRLSNFELFYGDARLLTREVNAYLAVGRSEVRDAVKKHLGDAQRSTVHVVPGESDSPEKGKP